eukprot:UC4_evm1s1064
MERDADFQKQLREKKEKEATQCNEDIEKLRCDAINTKVKKIQIQEKRLRARSKALKNIEISRHKPDFLRFNLKSNGKNILSVPDELKQKRALNSKDERRNYNREIYPIIKEALSSRNITSAMMPSTTFALSNKFTSAANRIKDLSAYAYNRNIIPGVKDNLINENNETLIEVKTIAQDGNLTFLYNMTSEECVNPTLLMIEDIKIRDCCNRILAVNTSMINIDGMSYGGEDEIPEYDNIDRNIASASATTSTCTSTSTSNINASRKNLKQLHKPLSKLREPFAVGSTFSSLNEAKEAAIAHAGAPLTQKSSRGKFFYFNCFRAGHIKASVKSEDRIRNKLSRKCGCTFQVIVKQNNEESFEVTSITDTHNHELFTEEELASMAQN